MDINFIDSELNVKIKETFKYILKKQNVKIIFNEPNDDIEESTSIKMDNHNFTIEKIVTNISYKMLNEKYYPLINKKLKDKMNSLSSREIERKSFYLFIFRPFYGKIMLEKNDDFTHYKMSYNSVVIDLSKLEYDRFNYYSKYVYKLQQLIKLNKELKINQQFNIIFDDDKAAHQMYNDIYDNFRDIIEPLHKNFGKPKDEEDDDDVDDE